MCKLVLFYFVLGFFGVWFCFCFSKWSSANFLIEWWVCLWLLHENIMWNVVKRPIIIKRDNIYCFCHMCKTFSLSHKRNSFFSVRSSQIHTVFLFLVSFCCFYFFCFIFLFTPHLRCSQIILLFSMSLSFSEINIWAAVNSQSDHGSFLLKSTGRKQVYKCFSQEEWTTTRDQVAISVLKRKCQCVRLLLMRLMTGV